MTEVEHNNKQDLVLSGSLGKASNSARAGYMPIALDRLPIKALDGIPVYRRTDTQEGDSDSTFVLYAGATVEFSEKDRSRLDGNGVKFIYIPIAEQTKFRTQVESELEAVAANSAIAMAEKSAIIYDTSVELMNELLSEPDLAATSPRLETVSRAVTTLVLNDPTAFSHLFRASHHDFYTATHMVNVATWMVPLAYALGYRDPEVLSQICQAGLLHDMGKLFIPENVLNKAGQLSDEDWNLIAQHPVLGCEHLEKFGNLNETILTITRQHHERLDGSGYPDGLKGDEIHPLSRICAVVDSFDAMTAFRPFKHKTFSVPEALSILNDETPEKYDPEVFEVWMSLITVAEPDAVGFSEVDPTDNRNRREHQRYCLHAPARLHPLEREGDDWIEQSGVQATVHSLSRSGLGCLSPSEIVLGQFVRVYMPTPQGGERRLEGQTVRCHSHKDGWYELGVRFAALSESDKPQPSRRLEQV